MRYMMLVKAAERTGPPPKEFVDAMEPVRLEAMRKGVLIMTGGLAATAQSTRIRVDGGKLTVKDGPFTEAKEVVGGFGVVEAASREEAVEGARRLMEFHVRHWPGWEGEMEVRQMFEAPPPATG